MRERSGDERADRTDGVGDDTVIALLLLLLLYPVEREGDAEDVERDGDDGDEGDCACLNEEG